MKLDIKIWILVILFSVRTLIYLVDGAYALIGGASYGEYGNAFVNVGIMGYIAYSLYVTRNKWAYWSAVIFTSFVLIRIIVGAGLIASSGIAPSGGEIILFVIFFVGFGIIPLTLLLSKELRAAYLTQK